MDCIVFNHHALPFDHFCIKLASGYRLHFYPDNETRTIFVGYIGPHLKLK